MKELIYVTGQIDHPFFTNEIEHFVKVFDSVHVISYSGDKRKCDELAKKYHFTYEFSYTPLQILKNILGLHRWRKYSYVKEEIKRINISKKNVLIKKIYMNMYGIYSISLKNKILKRMSFEKELYLYSFWLSRPAFAIATLNEEENRGIKRIVTRTHRYDLYEEENKYRYLPFRKYIAEHIDTIYFSSIDTYKYFVGKNYTDCSRQPNFKLSYLGTGVPLKVKKEKNEGKLVVASCSDIIYRKRLDIIIEIIRKINQKGQNVRWVHIGDGELMAKIKVEARNILTGVEYEFVGRLNDSDIYKKYYDENVDFFINMSDSEGIPVSVMEAMSMGIPIVARNVGGCADAIINNYNGMILEGDIDETKLENVADFIIDTFNNYDKYNELSEHCIEFWKNKFCGEHNMELVVNDIIENNVIPVFEVGEVRNL